MWITSVLRSGSTLIGPPRIPIRLSGKAERSELLYRLPHGFARNYQVKVNRVTRVLRRATDYSKRIKVVDLTCFLNLCRQWHKASTVCWDALVALSAVSTEPYLPWSLEYLHSCKGIYQIGWHMTDDDNFQHQRCTRFRWLCSSGQCSPS